MASFSRAISTRLGITCFLLATAAVALPGRYARPLAFQGPGLFTAARALSFEERVEAQRAIEQVYWDHRIWPNENPGHKPSLQEVMPEEVLRAKVEDYLKESSELETRWHQGITPEQLQAEMDRMVTTSNAPRVLGEIFDALGNDPRVIAETLVRQKLADRLIRSAYASDEIFISPPLVVQRSDVDEIVERFEKTLVAVQDEVLPAVAV